MGGVVWWLPAYASTTTPAATKGGAPVPAMEFTVTEIREKAVELGLILPDQHEVPTAVLREAKKKLAEERYGKKPDQTRPGEGLTVRTEIWRGGELVCAWTNQVPA